MICCVRSIANLSRHFSNHTLTTIKYHGPKRRCSLETLRATDLVITTYHTLASESSNSKGLLNQIEWYRLVLDEGMSTMQLAFASLIRKKHTSFADKTLFSIEL